jgi:hypothetical protein
MYIWNGSNFVVAPRLLDDRPVAFATNSLERIDFISAMNTGGQVDHAKASFVPQLGDG